MYLETLKQVPKVYNIFFIVNSFLTGAIVLKVLNTLTFAGEYSDLFKGVEDYFQKWRILAFPILFYIRKSIGIVRELFLSVKKIDEQLLRLSISIFKEIKLTLTIPIIVFLYQFYISSENLILNRLESSLIFSLLPTSSIVIVWERGIRLGALMSAGISLVSIIEIFLNLTRALFLLFLYKINPSIFTRKLFLYQNILLSLIQGAIFLIVIKRSKYDCRNIKVEDSPQKVIKILPFSLLESISADTLISEEINNTRYYTYFKFFILNLVRIMIISAQQHYLQKKSLDSTWKEEHNYFVLYYMIFMLGPFYSISAYLLEEGSYYLKIILFLSSLLYFYGRIRIDFLLTMGLYFNLRNSVKTTGLLLLNSLLFFLIAKYIFVLLYQKIILILVSQIVGLIIVTILMI